MTGGAGFIGSHTVVCLLEQDFRVVIVDNLCNSNVICIERIKQIVGSKAEGNLTFENADYTNFAAMDSILGRHKPSVVFHFAAYKAVAESMAKPLMYYQNNLAGTVTMLEVMQLHKCNTIVFSSSSCTYGSNPSCKEEDPRMPKNPYGRTKAMVE